MYPGQQQSSQQSSSQKPSEVQQGTTAAGTTTVQPSQSATWSTPAQGDGFLNTCVTIVAVLIIITLLVLGVILFRCLSKVGGDCGVRIPTVSNPYSNITATCDSNECRTFEILNNTVTTYRGQSSIQKASALYQGCINIDLRNSKGTKPLEDLLEFFDIPHWPVLNRTSTFKVFYLLANVIREIGLDVIISVRVGMDYHNADRYIIYIGQPSFGVETNVLRGKFRTPFFRILHRYKLFIYRCSLLLGSNVAAADVVNEIVAFEARLAAISEPPETIMNPRKMYNLMSIKTLEAAIPEIRWTYFINIVLRDVGINLDLEDHVVVTHPLYLKRLSRLLKEIPSSAVANYIGWRIVQTMGKHTIDRFRRASFRFDRYRYTIQDVVDVPRECVQLTARYMHFAVGRLYFDRHITKPVERYRKVYDLAEEVRDAFSVLIELNTWMDDDTKERARQKLHHLQMNIAYPPWLKSDRDLDEYYKDIPDLRKEEFFISLLRVLKIYHRITFSRLKRYRRAEDFGWYPRDKESKFFYSLLGNYMLLPVDYIQPPFFLTTPAPPVNFGSLGSTVGQHITYGFDEQGALYDERGKLVEWWSRDTHRKFLVRARCFGEQYDQFSNPITGRRLNTNFTLETSIADNAGLRESFKAYKVFMTKFEELYTEYLIPGLESITLDQLFFISYALSRCEVARKRSLYFFLRPRDTIPNRYSHRKYKRLEIFLMCLLILLIVSVVILSLLLASYTSQFIEARRWYRGTLEYEPCEGRLCLQTVTEVTQSLSSSVSACGNFYSHVCDDGINYRPIPESDGILDVESFVQKRALTDISGTFNMFQSFCNVCPWITMSIS